MDFAGSISQRTPISCHSGMFASSLHAVFQIRPDQPRFHLYAHTEFSFARMTSANSGYEYFLNGHVCKTSCQTEVVGNIGYRCQSHCVWGGAIDGSNSTFLAKSESRPNTVFTEFCFQLLRSRLSGR